MYGLWSTILSQWLPTRQFNPDFNDAVYNRNWKDALKILHSTNNFSEFTGRLCPAPCESAVYLGL